VRLYRVEFSHGLGEQRTWAAERAARTLAIRCANGCRDDQYRLDAFAYPGGFGGKGVSVWGAYLSCSGAWVNRYRIASRKWRPSTPLACLSSNSHRTKGGRPRLDAC
jgi:hypothetical protein